METGRQVVYIYDGHIAKSGKTIFEFGSHKLAHIDKVADKSALLVDVESRVILRSYPAKADRSVILNDLADNFKRLEHFLRNPESYEVKHRPKIDKKKADADEDVVYNIEREPSYSRSGNYAHLNKDADEPMKKYNQKEFRW